MADVGQAAAWMLRGHGVRRHIWGGAVTLCLDVDNCTLMVSTEPGRFRPYQMPVVDLIADDWELAPPAPYAYLEED